MCHAGNLPLVINVSEEQPSPDARGSTWPVLLFQMVLHMASLLSPLPGLLAEIHRDFYLCDKHLRPWVAPCQGSILSFCRSSPSFASSRLVFFPRSFSPLLAIFHHLILPPLSRPAFSARPPNVVVSKWKGICYGRWWMTSPIWRRSAPPTGAASCCSCDLVLTREKLRPYTEKISSSSKTGISLLYSGVCDILKKLRPKERNKERREGAKSQLLAFVSRCIRPTRKSRERGPENVMKTVIHCCSNESSSSGVTVSHCDFFSLF